MDKNPAVFCAITGGIGSGKSTVSAIIKEYGYNVISADAVARDIMENDEYVKNALIVEYGNSTFLPHGKLNTEHLSSIVFSSGNKEKIKKLNSIVHPPTLDRILAMAEELEDKGDKVIFAEIALLYESGLDEAFDYVIAVTASDDIRLQRVLERNTSWTKEHISQRMKEQADQGWVKNQADFCIENNSTLEKLRESVAFILDVVPFLAPIHMTENDEKNDDANTGTDQ